MSSYEIKFIFFRSFAVFTNNFLFSIPFGPAIIGKFFSLIEIFELIFIFLFILEFINFNLYLRSSSVISLVGYLLVKFLYIFLPLIKKTLIYF